MVGLISMAGVEEWALNFLLNRPALREDYLFG
jgi:hypothetical protein